MSLRRSHLVVALGSGVVTLLVTGGLAVASIPDTSGVIHACIKPTGVLRMIDAPAQRCTAKERALNWNQTGGQAFTARSIISTGIGFDYNTIVTVALPAGQYAISGQVIVSSVNHAVIGCVVDDETNRILGHPGKSEVDNSLGTVPVEATAVLTVAATLRLRCIVESADVPPPPSGGPVAAMSTGVLVATQVGGITDQTP